MWITFNFLLNTHFIKEINEGFLLRAKGSEKPKQMDTLMGIFTNDHNGFSHVLNQVHIRIIYILLAVVPQLIAVGANSDSFYSFTSPNVYKLYLRPVNYLVLFI